ncbi:hypothetical protein FDT66_05230 [Polaribacter aestuariivivens]|uniref:Uncharacterized protein n=1 Tax=Polaribacter aestuariivivens TaxID=2304626 RepID=A0A5S3NCH4_9FLAO|nr:hypothetical protein [Polaribacter aestuariivivens]TMM31369.1 hypothetical protein FDT66_05230 [Polaribacter aestuariivivens]
MKNFLKVLMLFLLLSSCGESDSGCEDAALRFKNNTSLTITITTSTNGIKTLDAGKTYTLVLAANTRVEYSAVTSTATTVHRWNNNITVKDCEVKTINLSL